MIGQLLGKLVEKKPPFVLLDVNGVGYEVETSMQSFYQLPELGQSVSLKIHFVVREDAQLLFGFVHEHERRLFRYLIKVNGVGPKMALAILSAMTPEEFGFCIEHQDIKQLTRIPGVGKKTAERLCVEVRDRLQDWPSAMPAAGVSSSSSHPGSAASDAIEALVALGYKPQEASRAVKQVANDESLSSEQLIRLSLKNL